MHFKFDFSAEWPSLPQCLALCLNIIIHSFFPPWPGELFPGLSLFCAFGLSLFSSLPSSPVPPVSLRPGDCLLPWVSTSATCVLASSSGACFPGVVCSVVYLRPRSHLRCLGSVFLLHPRFVRCLSLRRLCFFGAFAMKSPLSGSSVGCVFSHSIGTKA